MSDDLREGDIVIGTRMRCCQDRLGATMASYQSDNVVEIHRPIHCYVPSDPALRVKALDAWGEAYSEHIGPKPGAQVVARAWRDEDFRERLLADGTTAIEEFAFEGSVTGHLKAVENTDETHHLVVCTLCSCYSFSNLGMSPAWYKSAE